MNSTQIFVAMALAGATAAPAFAATNVALGAQVVTTGSSFGSPASWDGYPSIYEPSSIVSGNMLPDGSPWNQHTAYWEGSSFDSWITLNLANTATINSIVLQADNNDRYFVYYLDGSTWRSLAGFGALNSWGLVTRPELTLTKQITTNAFRIYGASGDGRYSVGQFAAFGNVAAVPEPESYAMLLAGLSLMGAIVRSKKQKA